MTLPSATMLRVLATTSLFAAGAAAAETAPAPKRAGTPPNIVLFLVDDMGWQDTSVPFWSRPTPLNLKYHTPNMERLAAQGVKFTQAYATPVCSPTRVSLLTGLNAARHRVTNWTLRPGQSTDEPHPRLGMPHWAVNGLQPPGTALPRSVETKCLPQYLRDAGYRTIHVGKAHFGALTTPGAEPRNLGFDDNIAGHAAGGPGSYLGEKNYSANGGKGGSVWDVPGLGAYHGTDTYLTEALTREALKAVDRARTAEKPFFLYLAHYAVHVPYNPDKRFIARYKKAGLNDTEAMYAALVEGMDKSLGDLLDYLERHHLADNTVVLFMSDNGGLSQHGRGGEPDTHNLPLARGKGALNEGGIRVPMLAKWPGVTRPGTVCATPLIIEDYFSTILEIAGARPSSPVDGVSFVPALRGTSLPERPLVWHLPNNWIPVTAGYGPGSAVRLGDWKYIFRHDPGLPVREELYHLPDDIGETKNLAAAHPDKLKELRRVLAEQLEKSGAQMPFDKQTGIPVAIPRD